MTERVVVIGAGPAGVTAVSTLVELGVPVLWLDAGEAPPANDVTQPLMQRRRGDDSFWMTMVGADLRALRVQEATSPKLRAPIHMQAMEGYAETLGITTENFRLVGSLTTGGLTNSWGAVCAAFDEHDAPGLAPVLPDLAESYGRVARRIGLSGPADDDLSLVQGAYATQPALAINATAAALLHRYQRRRLRPLGLRLGRPLQAVLSEDLGDRSGCRMTLSCNWGCPHGSIYSANREAQTLRRSPLVETRFGVVVRGIDRADAGYWLRLEERATAAKSTVQASCVFLAAGAVASSLLAADALHHEDAFRLECAPAFAFALLLPDRLGSVYPERDYAMAQLGYALNDDAEAAPLFGSLYALGGLPQADLIRFLWLTRPGAIRAMRLMGPAMLAGIGFLPGRYSNVTVQLKRGADSGRLHIRGAHAVDAADYFAHLRRRLARAFRSAGAWLLPGSVTLSQPGADIHYGASFPMLGNGPTATDALGQPKGLDGLHLIDGAALPALPSKSPTFTIMANADRIVRNVAATLGIARRELAQNP